MERNARSMDASPYRLEYDAVRVDAHARYADWAAFFGEVEETCKGMQHATSIDGGDLRHILVATLYARTLQHTSAANLLIERGLKAQSRVLLRAGMESLFSLAAVVVDEGFATQFLAADQIERRKLLKKSRSWTTPELRDQAIEAATDEKLAEIELEIERQRAKPLRTAQIAETANMKEWYTTAYAVIEYFIEQVPTEL